MFNILRHPQKVRRSHRTNKQVTRLQTKGFVGHVYGILKQAAGIAREEMTSLDAITAELLNFIQLKSQRLYMHSLQVANYSVSVAAKLTLHKSEIEQVKYAAPPA